MARNVILSTALSIFLFLLTERIYKVSWFRCDLDLFVGRVIVSRRRQKLREDKMKDFAPVYSTHLTVSFLKPANPVN